MPFMFEIVNRRTWDTDAINGVPSAPDGHKGLMILPHWRPPRIQAEVGWYNVADVGAAGQPDSSRRELMFCPNCGKEITGNPTFCSNCGAKLTEDQPAKKTWLGTTAGVLDIVDACLKLLVVFGLAVAIVGTVNDSERQFDKVDPLWVLVGLAVLLAILAVLAIIGGIYALQRKHWGVALAGAVSALLPFSLLGVAALIMTVIAREDFH